MLLTLHLARDGLVLEHVPCEGIKNAIPKENRITKLTSKKSGGNMREEITNDEVLSILKSISTIEKTEAADGNILNFTYKDKDDDIILCFVKIVNDDELSVFTLLKIPETMFISAIISCNMYNIRNDAHGTFAYAHKENDDACFIILEGTIRLRGGMSENCIRNHIRTFIANINLFEGVVIDGMKELGEDSEFLKGGFWQGVGSLLCGLWGEYNRYR